MNFSTKTLALLLILILVLSCNTTQKTANQFTKKYKPDNQELYNTIIKLDSTFFEAYNTCNVNLEKYGNFYSNNIEFYHDHGGIMTSKNDIIEGTKNNICGKVTRELVKGSIEVYPIKDFGAIEIGLHKFHNKGEPNSIPKVGRFTIIWKKTNSDWKIVKVISLH